MRFLCAAAVLNGLLLFDLAAQTVVGNYRTNFNSTGAPASPWAYLWNAPPGWDVGVTGDQAGGLIGIPESYRPLNLINSAYTADGDTLGGNNAPSGFMSLTATGGHPGLAAGPTNRQGRYAIVAFTVPSGGHYAIRNSFLSLANANSDGVEVLVFPGRSEAVHRTLALPSASNSFDVEIGHLLAGMVIYVAIGPGVTASFDAFAMDFDIVRTTRIALRQQLLDGISAGDNPIVLTPGRYYANPTGTYLRVSDFNPSTPVTLMAEGVELIIQTPNRAIGFVNSSNFTVKGLTIDYDPQLFRQGTVERINNNVFEMRLHEGYPTTLTNAATSGIVYDPVTRNMKALTNTIYPTGVTQVSPGLFAVTVPGGVPGLQINDYVSFTEAIHIPHAFYLEKCSDVSIEGLRIQGSPAFALLSRDALRVHLENVHVVPGPTPLRASVPRLLSSNADGLHFKHSLGDITMVNCHVAYAGDDCFVLTNSYLPIIEKDASNIVTLATKARTETIKVGDRLYVYDPVAGTRTSVTVEAVSPLTMDEVEIRSRIAAVFPQARLTDATYEQAFRVTLSNAITAGVGGFASNREGDAPNFRIEACTVFNTRARGILIKASDSVVRSNRISYTHLPGIQVRPESEVWLESDFAQNVIIEGNELTHTAIARFDSLAPIYVGSEGSSNWTPGSGHVNLDIRRNTISNAQSASIMVEYADNVRITSNRFIHSHHETATSPFYTSVIRLRRANDITINGLNLVMGINETNANLNGLISAPATGFEPVTNLTVSGPLLLDQDQDLLPDAWELQYFDERFAGDANADPDRDGLTNLQEFLFGLNPLQPDRFPVTLEGKHRLHWSSIPGRFVTIYATPSLDVPFSTLAENIPGELGIYDLASTANPSMFYRIKVSD